ncbi:hypothetical protein GCM10025868_15590 [Angustibacter aerolatus]|uniref:Penicillin amidase n=1 Tax=Angustibacter aerolatus TaxID=1162965 RepID=A0ABQ6JES2_9ACTN|nr:penicillin acylase family protein [Angustibacter aerolatus]GMA86309.1 hypothetical protein GCM10025868_15590 [Angustibacter aerolatus]
MTRTLGWRRVAEQEPAHAVDGDPRLPAGLRRRRQRLRERALAVAGSASSTACSTCTPDYRVEPWTPVDSLAWLKAMAWDLKGNYADEATRARLASTLSNRRIAKLYPRYPSDHAPIVRADDLQSESATSATTTASADDQSASALPGQDALRRVRQALDAVPSLLGSGDGLGSNAWVVSGAHTTTGRPLLANDPHLGLQVPSTWYQIGLHCRSVTAQCPFDVAGFTFSGLPGVVIGHNARVAWGFTNLDPDVTDFYLERVDGDQVEVDGGTEPLTTRQETLRVRGGADVALTVRSTRHGPILSDVISGVAAAGRQPRGDDQDDAQYDVSLAWTALTPGRTADAVFAIDRATDWTSFRAAARLFDVPSQNMVYADVDGHIGYQAPGRIPVRQSGSDGTVPVPGWLSRYDWKGTVPFEQPAHGARPGRGLRGHREPAGHRRARAVPHRRLGLRLPLAAHPRPHHPAAAARPDQPGRHERHPGSTSATRSPRRWCRCCCRSTSPTTRSPPRPSVCCAGGTTASSPTRRRPPTTTRSGATCCGSGSTTSRPPTSRPTAASGGSRSCGACSTASPTPGGTTARPPAPSRTATRSCARPSWPAGSSSPGRSARTPPSGSGAGCTASSLHHPVLGGSGVPAPVRSLVNLDGVAVGGGTGLVDATGWDAASGYQVVAGPSMRMVVDVGRFDDSTWVNLTGASGHPFDAHYDDQARALGRRPQPTPGRSPRPPSAARRTTSSRLTPDAP